MAKDEDKFWDEFEIPYQEEEEDFDFANPVTIADHFIRAVAVLGRLSRDAEYYAEDLAKAEASRDRAKRKLSRIRREILADNHSELRSSATSEKLEAFILNKAQDAGRTNEIDELEALIEEEEQNIEDTNIDLARIKIRLKALETKMHYAEQYLNYEKYYNRADNRYGGKH